MSPYTDEDVTTGEFPTAVEGPGVAPPRRGLIARIRADGLDLRNTWQIVIGAIILPLGVAAIILGWSGAAHGRVDQQQIPYLISGGILGLAGVIVGCFFYWAHWLYRIYDQADLHHQEAMREQAELARAMIEALGRMPSGSARPATNGTRPSYLATPTGSNFHTPECPVVANRQPNVRTVSEEEAENMRPCRICDPLATSSEGPYRGTGGRGARV